MKPAQEPSSIVVHAYPQFVFVWPVIVFGCLLAVLQRYEWVSQSAVAWTYIVIVCLVMITMGVDLGRNASIFCLVLFAGGWFAILWLHDVKDVMFFSRIGEIVSGLNPHISSQAMVAISVILAIMFVIMIMLAMINDRWRITHNEIEHRTLGHKEDATGRGAKRVLAIYPDILELLICLSGTIEVYSATGTQKLVTIKNVPLLPIRMRTISKILESSAVDDVSALSEEEEDTTQQ
jgi:hypothetical protein